MVRIPFEGNGQVVFVELIGRWIPCQTEFRQQMAAIWADLDIDQCLTLRKVTVKRHVSEAYRHHRSRAVAYPRRVLPWKIPRLRTGDISGGVAGSAKNIDSNHLFHTSRGHWLKGSQSDQKRRG